MPSLTKVQSGFMEAQGALPLSPGTDAAPGLKFSDSTGTGMFSPSTGVIGFSTGSTQSALTISTTGNTTLAGNVTAGAATFSSKVISGTTPDWQSETSTGIELNPAAATNYIGIKNSSASTVTNTAFQINHGLDVTTSILNSGAATFAGIVKINQTAQQGSTSKLEVTGTLDNSYPEYSYPLMVSDDAAYNSSGGPGGGIGFSFKQNSSGAYAQAGGIRGIKENTTDGNYASALAFYTRANGVGVSEKLRITSDGIVNVADRIYSPNIQHTPFILTASEKAVELWQHSLLSYSSSEEAFKFNYGSSYLSKSFFFGYNIDGAKGYDFEITGKNVTGNFYMKLYYSDGTDSGNWSINAWNPTSYSRNTISVPTNKKVRGFHINTSSSISGFEIYIKEIKIRRKSTDTNAPRDINVPDPMQFLSVMGGDTGTRQAVRSLSGYTAGGSREAGFVSLAASSGNNNISTGLNVNASNGGGAMMVLATRNTSNETHTDAGMYLLMFRYDGNHTPNVVHIGGDNFCTFGKNGSNLLTVNCGSGNWCVSGFFAGYGIGNQMH